MADGSAVPGLMDDAGLLNCIPRKACQVCHLEKLTIHGENLFVYSFQFVNAEQKPDTTC